jgi:hypothetical protein
VLRFLSSGELFVQPFPIGPAERTSDKALCVGLNLPRRQVLPLRDG